jgi:hypothetical protein
MSMGCILGSKEIQRLCSHFTETLYLKRTKRMKARNLTGFQLYQLCTLSPRLTWWSLVRQPAARTSGLAGQRDVG